MMMEPYTVALTSCGRFDLLERTLRSLLPRLDGPIERILIAEDSGDRSVLDVVRRFDRQPAKIEAILNSPPLGQVKSIDRLYSRIETDWIFHCEDDWEFFAGGFIGDSFLILKEFDHFSMMSLADRAKFEGRDYFLPGPLTHSGVRYFAVDPAESIWTGLSFNPGLRRMHDYRIVGPYADFDVAARERHVSMAYRELGYSFAYLAEPAVRHIGAGRHIRDRARPAGLGRKMAVSLQRRLARMRRNLNPQTDAMFRARLRQRQAEAGNEPENRRLILPPDPAAPARPPPHTLPSPAASKTAPPSPAAPPCRPGGRGRGA